MTKSNSTLVCVKHKSNPFKYFLRIIKLLFTVRYKNRQRINHLFNELSRHIAELLGTGTAFFLALLILLVWVVSGPLFEFSTDWQYAIHTLTSILIFLVLFILQNTQNRQNKEFHLKLNELIKSHEKAHNKMLDLSGLTDDEIIELESLYQKIGRNHSFIIRVGTDAVLKSG